MGYYALPVMIAHTERKVKARQDNKQARGKKNLKKKK
jgi:hypothetical protein